MGLDKEKVNRTLHGDFWTSAPPELEQFKRFLYSLKTEVNIFFSQGLKAVYEAIDVVLSGHLDLFTVWESEKYPDPLDQVLDYPKFINYLEKGLEKLQKSLKQMAGGIYYVEFLQFCSIIKDVLNATIRVAEVKAKSHRFQECYE